MDKKRIYLIIVVDCQWSEITWSRCSVSCQTNTDRGFRSGTRFVIQEAQNGGLDCSGNSDLEEPCQNLPQCGKSKNLRNPDF